MNSKHLRHAILVRRTAHNSAVGSKPTEPRRVLIAALLLAFLFALPAPVAALTSRYLFVSSHVNSKVVLYDGTTGALIGDFVTAGVGGLLYPFDIVFRPDGNLYVVNYGTNKVLRYNGTTGAPFPAPGQSGAEFATDGLSESLGLAFGPDGNLYVSSTADSKVVRFNGATGAYMSDLDPTGLGGLAVPTFLIFAPPYTTTTITSDNPDPSAVGQAVVVNFSVTSTSGTPTGSVTVSDGVDSCTGTVESGICTITLTTPGTRTLTATYAGDANFNGSSDTELHQVNAKLFLPLILR
jgi:DNA-binding beta-propeller fold protein YncE